MNYVTLSWTSVVYFVVMCFKQNTWATALKTHKCGVRKQNKTNNVRVQHMGDQAWRRLGLCLCQSWLGKALYKSEPESFKQKTLSGNGSEKGDAFITAGC